MDQSTARRRCDPVQRASALRRILIPCDGSEYALRAVQSAAIFVKEFPHVQVELLNVQEPVSPQVFTVMTEQQAAEFQANAADVILDPAKRLLDQSGVAYRAHYRVGSPANEIAKYIDDARCDAVMMGTRGLGLISLVIGSVTTRVIHLVEVPVVLIK
jgi:nucleotide-binding universal stress UspA family protein